MNIFLHVLHRLASPALFVFKGIAQQMHGLTTTSYSKFIKLKHLIFGLTTGLVFACAVWAQGGSVDQSQWDERTVLAVLTSELLAQEGAVGQAADVLYTEAQRLKQPDLLKRVVQWAAQAKKTSLASTAAVSWEKVAPKDLSARYAADYFVIQQGQWNVLSSRIATRTDPIDETQILHYLNLLDRNSLANSIKVYDAAVIGFKATSNQSSTQWLLARLAAATKQQDKLKLHLNNAILATPPVLEALFVQLKEDPEQTLTVLRQWTVKESSSAQAQRYLGIALAALGRHQEATLAYEQAILRDPKDVQLYIESIQQLRLTGQATKARQQLLTAYELAKQLQQANTVQLVGEFLEDDYHHDKALDMYVLAQKLAQGNEQQKDSASERQLTLKARLGDASSLEQLQQRLENAKDAKQSERLSYLVAGVLRDMGLPGRAVALLQSMPLSQERDYELALALEGNGQSTESELLLRQLLKAQPQAAHILNALGYGLVDRNASEAKLQEGTNMLEQAYASSPDSVAISDSLGWAYFRAKQFDKALVLLEKAYALKRDAEVGSHLAETLFQLGQVDRSRSILDELKRLDPKHKVLQDTLIRLRF